MTAQQQNVTLRSHSDENADSQNPHFGGGGDEVFIAGNDATHLPTKACEDPSREYFNSGDNFGQPAVPGDLLQSAQVLEREAADSSASTMAPCRPASSELATITEHDLAEAFPLVCGARRGQPTLLTTQLKTYLCAMLALGLTRRQAAIYADIDPSTISHAAQRDPDFARSLERAEELSRLQPILKVAAEGQRNWRAAAWLLTHQTKHPAPLTPEQYEAIHQRNMQLKRYYSAQQELEDQLSEQREKAKRKRKQEEQQARFEAENPQFFRKKKKPCPKPEKAE